MQDEVWKDIPSYEGLYQVSNLGNVKSLNKYHHKREQILKPKKDKYGYLCVRLSKNGELKDFTIHRLVMLSFVGESNLTVNHKDENKKNNRLDNLEYMSNKDNVRYSQAHKIKAINIDTGDIIYFNSTKETNLYGFQQANVLRVLKGQYKQHKGYIWQYVDKEV